MTNEATPQNIKIRLCEAVDFELIFGLLQQLWPKSKLNKELLSETYLSILNSKDHITLCAVSNNQIVALGTLSIKKSLYAQGTLAHIDELVVDEKHRSKGIGNKLLNELTQRAIEQSCTIIELDTALHRDQAHKFYERDGFEKTAYVLTKFLK